VALIYVYTATDEARECPGLVIERYAAIKDPAVHTVAATEAILHLERLTPLEVVQIVRYAAIEIATVHAFGPARAHFLFERAPRERQPRLVEVVAVRIEARAPDHDRRMLDQETVFCGGQRSTHNYNYCSVEPPSRDGSFPPAVRLAAALRV